MPLPDYTKDPEFDLPLMNISVNTVVADVLGETTPFSRYKMFDVEAKARVVCCGTNKSVPVMKVTEALLVPCLAQLLPLAGLSECGKVLFDGAFKHFVDTLDGDFAHWGDFARAIPKIAESYYEVFGFCGFVPVVYVGNWMAPGRPGRTFDGASVSEHVLLHWIAQHGGNAIFALTVQPDNSRLIAHWKQIFRKALNKGLFSFIETFTGYTEGDEKGMKMILGVP